MVQQFCIVCGIFKKHDDNLYCGKHSNSRTIDLTHLPIDNLCPICDSIFLEKEIHGHLMEEYNVVLLINKI